MTIVRASPAVSVITPVYNCAPYLEEALASALAQTFTDWEIILVDDGSTDDSDVIAERFARNQPDKARFLRHPDGFNRGAGASRNLALEHARGNYIALLDGDDVWVSTKLEEQMALLEACPKAGMIYGRSLYWRSWAGRPADVSSDFVSDGGVSSTTLFEPPSLLKSLLRYQVEAPCPSNVLLRREAAVQVDDFFEDRSRRIFEDQSMWVKVMLRHAVLVHEACWIYYRLHTESVSALHRLQGSAIVARLDFLSWVAEYFRSQNVTDPDIWRALRSAAWPHQHPRLYRMARLAFALARAIRGVPKLLVR
jgi:glycosyltransferase involved in cell wall biosynthesis